MAFLFAYGDALVTPEEVQEKSVLGDFERFEAAVARGDRSGRVEFRTGTLRAESARTFLDENEEPAAFTPIGLGKPLCAEIRHVYTGKHPDTGWFGDDRDLLLTSALKSLTSAAAAPRAVNHVKPKTRKNSNVNIVAATEQGTPIVKYSPAMTDESLTVTVELVFDNFPDELFARLGNAFQQAAGIPIFATASMYLVAGSSVAKLIGKLGKAIFDGKPIFSESKEIVLFRPGRTPTPAGYAVLLPEALREQAEQQLKVAENGALVRKDNEKLYEGEHPYVALAFDGKRRSEAYEQFNPVLASAELLDRFYNIGENKVETLDVLIESLELYNDHSFRARADRLKKRIAGLPDGEEKAELQKLYEAYLANIKSEHFKPV